MGSGISKAVPRSVIRERGFNNVDANNDGKITFEELKAEVSKLKLNVSDQQIREVLQRFDANGDGHIDKQEFQKLIDYLSYEPKFISLGDFKKAGRIPRCGSQKDFQHPRTGQPNAESSILRLKSSFNEKKTVFIFVSHRWLSPGQGAKGHPDNEENAKYKLLLKLIEKLIEGEASPVPGDFEVALWIGEPCLRCARPPTLRR